MTNTRMVKHKFVEQLYKRGKGGFTDINVVNPEYVFGLSAGLYDGLIGIGISVDDWYFRDYRVGSEEKVIQICDDLVSRCIAAYNYLRPVHGYGDWGVAIDYIRRRDKDDTRNIYWLNFYGRSLVDRIGRHKFLDLPRRFGLCEVTELEDGGIFVRAGKTPADTGETGAMKRYLFGESIADRFMKYLGRR
ncbi:hypothetical protein HYU15_03060 [Candidatus Woesearchaeota archaeon]|nr:hypothetical protein [Candidatus Woesearchaeota archaeon]